MIPFERRGDSFTASFAAQEVDILRELIEQEIALLAEVGSDDPEDASLAEVGIGGSSTPPRDPALARLLPDAYRDDAEAASEYRRLTEASMVARKIASARGLVESLGEGEVSLNREGAELWLRATNDLRLVIASRLGIVEDDDAGTGDEVMQDVYYWLGYLQGSLLDAMGA
ncbi:hypothetical protein HDC94_002264 [Leifsonia sp. AK011]|uniref:DUF2017 domain-containing protein n=1 Tax=Leifsonia sp. AK011 TaxID=2723075 RepID=UPI0015CE3E52|nr:DUF2017 domain-containing protein [Leifsonia sp. AK011]NYF11108.1 hypothetical protein [Leifsonia sp. AK011]